MTEIRMGSLGDRVAAALRARIIRGDIPAGTHLVEDVLATEYDVSRGPIRDALRLLATEGLIEPQRRGVLVKPFVVEDVLELYTVREAIERLSVRQAAALSGYDWTVAHQFLAEMRAAAETGDKHAFAHSDLEFHTAIYRATSNSRLLGMWQQLRPVFAVMMDITNERDRDLRPAAQDHATLLEAISRGDATGAEHILISHLQGSRNRMEDALAGQTTG